MAAYWKAVKNKVRALGVAYRHEPSILELLGITMSLGIIAQSIGISALPPQEFTWESKSQQIGILSDLTYVPLFLHCTEG